MILSCHFDASVIPHSGSGWSRLVNEHNGHLGTQNFALPPWSSDSQTPPCCEINPSAALAEVSSEVQPSRKRGRHGPKTGPWGEWGSEMIPKTPSLPSCAASAARLSRGDRCERTRVHSMSVLAEKWSSLRKAPVLLFLFSFLFKQIHFMHLRREEMIKIQGRL